jgi:hypothetical protein
MATKHEHDSGNERNPSVGFDKSDLGARGILIFFLVLAVSAVAVHLCVLGMYVGMTRIADKHDPEVSPLAPNTVTPRAEILTNTANVNVGQFPQPRLLRHIRGSVGGDLGEMTKFLLQETAVLTAKPWQDAQGNVHMPIEQAMKMVATQLPVRAGAAALPNYPGAGREYINQDLPAQAQAQAAAAQNESVEAKPAIRLRRNSRRR